MFRGCRWHRRRTMWPVMAPQLPPCWPGLFSVTGMRLWPRTLPLKTREFLDKILDYCQFLFPTCQVRVVRFYVSLLRLLLLLFLLLLLRAVEPCQPQHCRQLSNKKKSLPFLHHFSLFLSASLVLYVQPSLPCLGN